MLEVSSWLMCYQDTQNPSKNPRYENKAVLDSFVASFSSMGKMDFPPISLTSLLFQNLNYVMTPCKPSISLHKTCQN